jgi:hypothetical protein
MMQKNPRPLKGDRGWRSEVVVPTEIRLYPSCFIRIKSHCDYYEIVEGKRGQEPLKVVWNSGQQPLEDEKNK